MGFVLLDGMIVWGGGRGGDGRGRGRGSGIQYSSTIPKQHPIKILSSNLLL